MRVLLNDLSLRGLPGPEALRTAVVAILEVRRRSRRFAGSFFCSRQTSSIAALGDEPLINSVRHIPRDERTAFVGWLAKAGPYFDDERTRAEDDLYYLFDDDVTYLGPGEAARQRQIGSDAQLLSMIHAPGSPYDSLILNVLQGLQEEPIAEVPVPNFTDPDVARAAVEGAAEEPWSWPGLLAAARDAYPNLQIGSHCDTVLAPLPFYPTVSRRALELLRVLHQLVEQIDASGSMSEAGMRLYQAHFVGEKVWFSDESDRNKDDFWTDMSFPDPDDPKRSIQCFWHGKVKTPQYRIHFEWPMPPGSERLKVCYIGPKIAKR